jgi:hypothetical protein
MPFLLEQPFNGCKLTVQSLLVTLNLFDVLRHNTNVRNSRFHTGDWRTPKPAGKQGKKCERQLQQE